MALKPGNLKDRWIAKCSAEIPVGSGAAVDLMNRVDSWHSQPRMNVSHVLAALAIKWRAPEFERVHT